MGFRDYVWYTTPPKNAMDVYVMGKKWMWKFAYAGGGPNAIGTLHVPANRPVRLLMTSRDVIHSFFVPDFRIKQDVLPGRYTETWFEATKPGRYQILCTEYCGTWHSQMWGEVVVMPGPEFDDWMVEQKAGLAERVDTARRRRRQHARLDRRLRQEGRRWPRAACKCHSVDGAAAHRPDLAGPLPAPRDAARAARAVVADEAYLTESMIDPRAKVVKGFKPIMPTYRGGWPHRKPPRSWSSSSRCAAPASRTCPPRKRRMSPAKPACPARSNDKPRLPGGRTT